MAAARAGARERLRGVFSVSPDSVGTLRQVHSAAVLELLPGDAGCPDAGARAGDGLFTAVPGTGVGVRTADCVPILLAHPGVGLQPLHEDLREAAPEVEAVDLLDALATLCDPLAMQIPGAPPIIFWKH